MSGDIQKLNEEMQSLKLLVKNLEEEEKKKAKRIENLEEEENKKAKRIESLEEEEKKKSKRIESLEKEDKIKSKKLAKLQKGYKDQGTKIAILNLKLQRISFRDVSKIILDKMIEYVNERVPNFFKDINGRKKSLEKIIKDYNFIDIQFMKKPLEEIKDKYYNSNDYSHVPSIIQRNREKPYGMKNIEVDDILKKYYEIMVDSKSEQVYSFLKQEYLKLLILIHFLHSSSHI